MKLTKIEKRGRTYAPKNGGRNTPRRIIRRREKIKKLTTLALAYMLLALVVWVAVKLT